MFLAIHSTDESTPGYILRRQDAMLSYPEFIMDHGEKIEAVPSHAALCSHHDVFRLSNEKGWTLVKMVSGAVTAGSEGDNSSHLLLVARTLLAVLMLITLAKVCFPS